MTDTPSTVRCPLCQGQGCEENCGHCEYAHSGPDSHRICNRCGGTGRVVEDKTPPLLTREQAVASVKSLLNNAITPTVFWLHDESFEAHLTVDPDIAFEAIQQWYAERRGSDCVDSVVFDAAPTTNERSQ